MSVQSRCAIFFVTHQHFVNHRSQMHQRERVVQQMPTALPRIARVSPHPQQNFPRFPLLAPPKRKDLPRFPRLALAEKSTKSQECRQTSIYGTDCAQELLQKHHKLGLNCETVLTHVSSGVKAAFAAGLGRKTDLFPTCLFVVPTPLTSAASKYSRQKKAAVRGSHQKFVNSRDARENDHRH